MNWVACVGHLMPGAKLTAISSCLVNWFKNSVETKVVIFTQFLGMAHVLGSMCQENRWGHLSLTGKMPIRQREKCIEEFSKDPAIRILVCSLRTAGTGLDLTAANKCILVDLWWNEAIEQQAFFRLFRINQKRKVEFVRVVVRNSIDDRLQLIQEDKSNNIDRVLGSEVLSSRDSLASLCTVLGVEQDDGTETGYRFISDEEAERRCEAARVTVLDGEFGKDPGHAEADKCESSASNTGSKDFHITPLSALGIEGIGSTEAFANTTW
ncbi:DNA repair helicase RAD5,16, SNF2 family helicase [Histoplasma capsulatum G186AR]|uniref:DNA repair helicase RAD5,16, SNF2 family helicase n=1 Tax=Ajellomyces capsulatus TaxID=5037 RepID=A0A8H7ZBX2_AJECA|nr:DNA repair helicase RAD5,16, SNF2 family helicase [Histoplasma capsulatum]QSS75728.1 DNA repair helicase RAD5,16, SNF2 family helicase [Histoplasma capsulatum G186AR]